MVSDICFQPHQSREITRSETSFHYIPSYTRSKSRYGQFDFQPTDEVYDYQAIPTTTVNREHREP